MRGLSQCAEGALQRPLVHVADAVDHDELAFDRIDDVVSEDRQGNKAIVTVPYLKTTRPAFDIGHGRPDIHLETLTFSRTTCFQ